jgi:ankyrin repeat protein
MDTYLKLSSVRNDKTCNCISPFYINSITGINPNTGREYSKEDLDIMKTALYRISAAKGCSVTTCCDPNDPTSIPDEAFTKDFKRKYPLIIPMYEGSQLLSIKLSTTLNVKESGWIEPTPYYICKITKATIQNTDDPNVQLAVNLVNDCYNDTCNSVETITVDNLLQNSRVDMNYTSFDDARVSQAILDGNISYVKEYIRKYNQVDMPLTNNDYRNRMIHLAAESSNNNILTMLISLKANINIQNKLGETPIHFAVRGRHIENINNLLMQGVDLTIPTSKGETPMYYAMTTGDMRVINMLYTSNSPVLGVDKEGNNLIHYCILNCPSYKEDNETVPNTKSEIIQWLIDHGISTEQPNTAGITPLELVSREINKEVDLECAIGIKQDQDNVIEKFFGGSYRTRTTTARPFGYKSNNLSRTVEHFTNGGAQPQNISKYTPEHLSLLDIQSKIFNNIIRNNPVKYNGYISVDEIPKGAPINVLDTICVGSTSLSGNEDSDECIAKGGQLVKVKNKTTKIKLELISKDESATDAIDQKELYYKKISERIPKGTVPDVLSSYNANVRTYGDSSIRAPQVTTSITYPIATGSDNLFNKLESALGISKDTNTSNESQSNVAPTLTIMPLNTLPATTLPAEEHPSILNENDQIVSKCKLDAIRNSTNMNKTTTTIMATNTTLEGTLTTSPFLIDPTTINNYIQVVSDYKNPILITILVLLALIIGFLIYKQFFSSQSVTN